MLLSRTPWIVACISLAAVVDDTYPQRPALKTMKSVSVVLLTNRMHVCVSQWLIAGPMLRFTSSQT